MSNENNKMQVDIDNLFKQNVNDLSAIKELYRRIEEIGEKITQIKYIDNTLVKKLKKEYENLKKIILDENVQTKLADDIKTINSQQVKLTNDIESINSQLDTIKNEEVIANRHGLNIGMDMYEIVQGLLLRDDVAKVKVLEGDYTLSNKIIIPEGKQLILTGDNGAVYVYDESDISSRLFTKIKPTFNTGYCFELYDKSSLIGGFVDCSSLTSGGGVYLDFSQKCIHAIRINTVLFGGFNWNNEGITINGDRPTGTKPGYGYYIDINCGISGFGCGVHLLRLNTQTSLTDDANGLAWINGITINGNFMRCQRYVYFETSHNAHAGGSSYIGCRIQGGSVPNKDIPAVEIGGDDITLNCQFHDVSANHSQKIRYKINGINTRVEKEKYSNGNIIDSSNTTVYKMPNDVVDITQGTENASEVSGWYIKEGFMCKVFMRLKITVSSSWVPIYELPYAAKKTARATVISDRGETIPVLVSGNNLLVINNNELPTYINLSIDYPIVN